MSNIEVEHADVVVLGLEGPRPQRRLTVAFRVILAIPHWIYASLLGIAVFFAVVAAWLAALLLGRMPDGLGTFISRTVQYYGRVYSYGYYLLTDRYPPFALDDVDYPVTVTVPMGGRLNRAAVLFRAILMIPAAFVTAIVTGGLNIALFFIWLIILVAGRMPNALFEAEAAILRYQLRTFAYIAMLTSEYPRGLFGDKQTIADMPLPSASPPETFTPEATYAPTPAGLPAQPRVTRLVLSKAAKRLIVLFIVLGVLFQGGSIAISAMSAAEADRAADELEREYVEVSSDFRDWSTAVQTCGFGDGAACVHEADLRLVDALNGLRRDLSDIDVPGQYFPDLRRVDDDVATAIDLLRRRAETTDLPTVQRLSSELLDVLTRFDRDYIQLINSLRLR